MESITRSETPIADAERESNFLRDALTLPIKSLDKDGNGHVLRKDFFKVLANDGLIPSDPRLSSMFEGLANESDAIPLDVLLDIAVLGGQTVLSALTGNMVVPDFARFRDECKLIYDDLKTITGGKVASYIPQLAKVPPTKFAVAVTTVDGQQFSFGDASEHYCLQSVSKIFTYCEILKQHGTKEVHKHVGREPSGLAFNAMTMKSVPADKTDDPNRTAIPHNPLINAGAIMCCSLMNPQLVQADRLSEYIRTCSRCCGETAGFDPTVMMSERATADRNTVLAYMMKECGAYAEPNMTPQSLADINELYFSTCAVTCNARMMATAGAVFASGGINPLTNDHIFDTETCRNALSLMLSCGMYDFSGEWAFQIGLPAKSGVSGCIMIVIPNVMGICVWSPPLDEYGNSVKGVEFAKRLCDKFAFHGLEPRLAQDEKEDLGKLDVDSAVEVTFKLLFAASSGDLVTIQRIMATGGDMNAADYDARTALHLAASEGHTEVVAFLLAHGVQSNPADRWGNTPLDDAKTGKFTEIIELLDPVG
jgi:glutaminase